MNAMAGSERFFDHLPLSGANSKERERMEAINSPLTLGETRG
jgi:hypothetical protein